ncbi:phosphatase PAP2 family protein [Streptomyces sp. NBC_01571]|uniref:phosphatase PAP2 family protein n=1 Tax=Streptomyces sp. NBC_01571 TaxID=2975883 RepID=UPI0022512CC7|nr:phosphatase PAP2 family protein [Streptomyces sp. NBC_01571]MCX4572384.1 phosphatase PAP2 family protein [Streptomyces sp. NBC_01571]
MKRADTADLAGSTAVGSLVAFVLLTLVVTGRDGGTLFGDDALGTWSAGHRPAVALALARAVTYTGTGLVPYALVVLAGAVAGRTARERILRALACLGCLATAQTVRYAVMTLVARPRPAAAGWATHASGWSFPSGHTTTSAVSGGLLVLALLARAPRSGRPLALVVGCWSVLVGLSRVYLGVHWFSDVLGGWLFALCWLSLTVYVVARFVPPRHSSIAALRPRPDALTTEERRNEPHPRRKIPPRSPP